MKVLAVPVAFNEETKIGSVLDRFHPGLVDEVLVLDDGSTDRTAEVVRNKGVKILSHESRRGVGAGIRSAIRYAREHGYDAIVILAGNDKDRPSEIPRLLAPILEGQSDFVQGSRYLPGGDFGNMPAYRQIATRWIHPLLFSLITRSRITDSTNGMRAIRLSILDDPRIRLDQEWLDQYELEPYLLYQTIRLGYRFKEVPVTKIYPQKSLGYTKMKPITGWWSILRPIFLLSLGLRK
ncbi:MAG TPA: glycosyltransferase family 2 protein [Acidobacteriota bacterium]|nr:glycosyltransferase family 2 protein [Acidobacteriota bacterium]